MASTAGNGSGNGSLPTHTTTKDAADLEHRRRRRRCLCCCLLITVVTLLILAITLLVLFLTVLRVRDPTTRLVATRLAGVAPRLTAFPTISIQLNVTLLLTVAVHNPNPASFAYASGGHTDLTYRGAHVGDAEIDPGRIPSKGDGNVTMALTLQADSFARDLGRLVDDVMAGSVPLDASTRIPGRVAIFGVFKRHAVAYSDCHFVFGVSEMGVRSQQCSDRTKL